VVEIIFGTVFSDSFRQLEQVECMCQKPLSDSMAALYLRETQIRDNTSGVIRG